MTVEYEILTVLREAGAKGMPLRRIALNVFNMKNTFFLPLEKETVYNNVAAYLRTVSTRSGAPVMKAERKGWYRINAASPEVRQMQLEFKSEDTD